MSTQKPSITAQRLMNLYRQAHVIIGGWAAVNEVFIQEANAEVLEELEKLPTGRHLAEHIGNLLSGKTKQDSIERELLPYGGAMAATAAILTSNAMTELGNALKDFQPDAQHLEAIKKLRVVKEFGDQWQDKISAAVAHKPNLAQKWRQVVQTATAYDLWNSANYIVQQPLTERARAQVQADLPEYETYLPMFGADGTELLSRLRKFVSVM